MTESQDIQPQNSFKILLIGDSCIDEYIYGTCDRLNPEAPVPVLKVTRNESKMGMAANVKLNLESFGCDVDLMTGGVKSIKQRYIDERSKQHIVRVDDDRFSNPFNPCLESLHFAQYDAIVISDYNKGYVTYENAAEVRSLFSGPIFMDTKKPDLAKFKGIYVKVNESEYNNRTSINDSLIVTLGENGAMYKQDTMEIQYEAPSVDVVDVCGAGDTFLSALAYYFLKKRNILQAIEFANKCAAISVTHRGVYSLTLDDIENIDGEWT